MSGFVHLHLHSQYSILDGAIRLKPLMSEIAKRKVKAVALTDHGAMHGIVDFINKAKSAGVKPILGCEFNVTGVHPASQDKPFHLTALCRTLQGYQNAMALLSRANIERFNELTGTATIDFEWFRTHAEGLTILSGDLGGELAQTILRKGDADGVMTMMRDIFEPGQFYLEVMPNSFESQKTVNNHHRDAAKRLGLPLVATNDCHYLKREEAFAHAVLVCIALKKQVDVETLRAAVVDDFYLKTDDEMYAAFPDMPQACENTVAIAEAINFEVPLDIVHLPTYEVPDTFLEAKGIDDKKLAISSYFESVAKAGLKERFASFAKAEKVVDEAVYWERLNREIDVINAMDFPGYFLIVWDFIRWAKEQGIPVGPGRGSGAGSLVAYALSITDLDPLPFSLLFERFLNPERVSMPDFDIDFCMDRRGEVIKYVTERYGVDRVAQIATFGALKAKQAINSVGRVMNFLPSETRAMTKLVPNDLTTTLSRALVDEPRLKAMVDDDPRVAQLYKTALELEDLYCQTGIHAAGIVISEGPLWDYVPIFKGANKEIVAQYAKNEVEQAGLVKFDFLGLKTLTVVQRALGYINEERQREGQEPLDISLIPLTDKGVYQMIAKAQTTGVFQLESGGFKKLLSQLKPDCFEDVIAAVALYRPGPMGSGMIDQFIECKHGLREIVYPHPLLSGILRETYGVFVYQEQVMQAAQVLSGFTLGGADIMRRAMGKKKPEEMAKQRSIFVSGARNNGVDEDLAGEIFDNIEKFAGYGFNKSHSAAYALITYQTAYLKHHYPVALYAALLTCDSDNPDKVIRIINDARATGVKILPPDVNASGLTFNVVGKSVRFGLAGVKGIGEAVIESILAAREDGGSFKSLFDFCERVDERVNKRAIEVLIECGAFDSVWPDPIQDIQDIGHARARMMATVTTALDRSKQAREDKKAGQSSLFSLFSGADKAALPDDKYADAIAWSEATVIENEFALIGFFVSGHPLDKFTEELALFGKQSASSLSNMTENARVSVCGILKTVSQRTTKTGAKMATGQIEDMTGQASFICFPRSFEAIGAERFSTDQPVVLSGRLKFEGDDDSRKAEIMVDSLDLLTDLRQSNTARICFNLTCETHTPNTIDALKALLDTPRYEGKTLCFLNLTHGDCEAAMPLSRSVSLSEDFMKDLESVIGRQAYCLKLGQNECT